MATEDDARDETRTSEGADDSPAGDAWSRQLLGALVGALAGLLVLILGESVGALSGDRVRYMLWGSVVGGLIGASEKLADAGKGLTKRDEPWLNILVALIGMAVITGVVFALALAITRLVGPALDR